MNLLLLGEEDFLHPEVAVVRDRRFRHLVDVLKVTPGDEVAVGAVNGKSGMARVSRCTSEEIELAVSLERDPPEPLPLTLAVALPRPKVLNRLLASSASLGVKRLWLINAWRVEKSYWESPRLSDENIRRQSLLGLEQARDTILPQIRTARFFRQFVEEELPAISRDTQRFFAHPAAVTAAPRNIVQAVTLIIGPEGGFIAEETASLERAGFTPVTLGPRILRTETAVATLIGRMF